MANVECKYLTLDSFGAVMICRDSREDSTDKKECTNPLEVTYVFQLAPGTNRIFRYSQNDAPTQGQGLFHSRLSSV